MADDAGMNTFQTGLLVASPGSSAALSGATGRSQLDRGWQSGEQYSFPFVSVASWNGRRTPEPSKPTMTPKTSMTLTPKGKSLFHLYFYIGVRLMVVMGVMEGS
jgi:hypothetical protein